MSQDEVECLLMTFGPLPASEMTRGLGKNPKSISENLRRLKKSGAVSFYRGTPRNTGLYDVIRGGL
jgi:predicted transcriptional regulator